MEIKDIIIVIFSLFDVVCGAVLALSYGFFMAPSAVGYIVGAIGGVISGSATPISFMYENMAISWNQSKDLRDRISMIIFAAAFTGLLGVFHLPQFIVNVLGEDVFLAMMAGVGLYLARVGLDIALQQKIIGIPCMIIAVFTQFITGDLVWTVTVSVLFGMVLYQLLIRIKKLPIVKERLSVPNFTSWRQMIQTEFRFIYPVLNRKVLIGTLSLSTLTIGGNIAYTAANSQISKTLPTYNQSTIISSLADFVSSFFGGANMEIIISPTAAAPHPVAAAVLFMALAALLLLCGVVNKIARFLPLSAMGGYLFVVGALLVTPFNIVDALKVGHPVLVGLTMAVTAFSNPFFGILAGTMAKFIVH